MKKTLLLTIVTTVLSVTAFSQTNKPAGKKDSVYIHTPLLTIGDISQYQEFIKTQAFLKEKLTVKEFESLLGFFTPAINRRVEEFYSKQK